MICDICEKEGDYIARVLRHRAQCLLPLLLNSRLVSMT